MSKTYKSRDEILSAISSNRDIMLSDDGWIDLSSIWMHIESLGKSRDIQKKTYQSSKNWSLYSTHTLGLIGEVCFSIHAGISPCLELLPEGDGSVDFFINGKSIDIKTTRYWKDPDLKQYPNPKKWADIYILCAVDIEARRAKIFGWASKEDIMKANKVNYGYGEQFSISHRELNKEISSIINNAISGLNEQ